MENTENLSAAQVLMLLREQIYLTTDMDLGDKLSLTFKEIFQQVAYLERCLRADIDPNHH